MKVVNLFAGPGTGKSTTAAGLFAELKHRGWKTELVTEVAKDLCYENSPLIENQLHILSEQFRRLDRLRGQVDIVVTDAPIALSLTYMRGQFNAPWFADTIRGFAGLFDNTDIFLKRVKPYQKYGRTQTEEEARGIDFSIHSRMAPFDLEIPADRAAAVTIADFIESNS